MEPSDNQFQPKHVDEQIEWLAQYAPEDAPEHNLNAQLVQRLQGYYASEKQRNTLAHAWKAIAQRYEDGVLSSTEEEYSQHEQKKTERSGQYRMQYQTAEIRSAKRRFHRWSTMAAVAVLALVIGSATVIMSQAALHKGIQGTTGSSGGGSHLSCYATGTATPPRPTPTPASSVHHTTTPTPAPSIHHTATPTPSGCATPTPVLPTSGTLTPTPTQSAPTPVPTPGTPTPVPTQSAPTPVPTQAPGK